MFDESNFKITIDEHVAPRKSQHISSISTFMKTIELDAHKRKQKRIDNYYSAGNIINFIIILIFAWSYFFGPGPSLFLQHVVGLIVAYYILKAPFETK